MADGRLQTSVLVFPWFPFSSQSSRLSALIVGRIIVAAFSQKSSTTEMGDFTPLQILLV